MYNFDPDVLHNVSGGFFKNAGRIYPQTVFFIVTVSLVFILPCFVRTESQIIEIVKLIINLLCVCAILGLLQYIYVVIIGGDNPFPINGRDGGHSGYIKDLTFRVNSIVGEPKHFGIAMVLGVTILFSSILNDAKIIKNEVIWLCVFLIMIMLALSTTSFVLTVISVFSILLINKKIDLKVISLVSIVILVLCVYVINMSSIGNSVITAQLIKAGFEIQDQSIIDFFLTEPWYTIFGTGIGNIHHYAVHYLPSEFPLFKDTPYKGNSGLIVYISDFGIVGFLLIMLFVLNSYKDYIRNKLYLSQVEVVVIQTFLVLSLIFVFRYTELFFFFAGLNLAIQYKRKQE